MTIKLPEPVPFMASQGQHVYTHAQLVQAVKDALEEAAVIAHNCIGPAPIIRRMKEDIQ